MLKLQKLTKKYLNYEDVNIIRVDYSKVVAGGYIESVGSIRVIFILFLILMNVDKFVII